MDKQELIKEYARCLQDTNYAIKTYLETYDNTQSKYVPFDLFPEQEMMLKNFENITTTSLKNIDKRGIDSYRCMGF